MISFIFTVESAKNSPGALRAPGNSIFKNFIFSKKLYFFKNFFQSESPGAKMKVLPGKVPKTFLFSISIFHFRPGPEKKKSLFPNTLFILSQHTSISRGLVYLLGNFTCPLDALHCVLVHF